MTNRSTLWRLFVLAGLSGTTLGLLPGTARADTRLVDCSAGRKIAPALRLPAGRQLTVIVKGACNENITIARDNVTLQGDAVAGGTVNGTDPARDTILIDGARRVIVDRLTVSGARSGIVGTAGAVFTVQNSVVRNNVQNGVVAIAGSSVTVAGSQLRSNGSRGEGTPLGDFGLLITDGSSGVIVSCVVSANGRDGIMVRRSSSATIGRTLSDEPGPNIIENNGESGVDVDQLSRALVHGNTIRNNTGGIDVGRSSAARIRGNTISGNGQTGISVGEGSSVGIEDSTISGNGTGPDPEGPAPGIAVGNGATVVVENTEIRSNVGTGVIVDNQSYFRR